jgi:hypothetical protein
MFAVFVLHMAVFPAVFMDLLIPLTPLSLGIALVSVLCRTLGRPGSAAPHCRVEITEGNEIS